MRAVSQRWSGRSPSAAGVRKVANRPSLAAKARKSSSQTRER
ncbi:hypothetical protein SGRIM128S_05767 [Streptomyces griseomycini]